MEKLNYFLAILMFIWEFIQICFIVLLLEPLLSELTNKSKIYNNQNTIQIKHN